MRNKEQKYLTKENYQKLKKDLAELETAGRKKVAADLNKAASYGDLSENAAYDDAKDAQSFLEGKILELRMLLKNAQVIESNQTGVVQIGSKIKVESEGERSSFEIVGFGESDILKNKISYESPLGKAFIGKKVGSEFLAEIPRGKVKYKIIEIK